MMLTETEEFLETETEATPEDKQDVKTAKNFAAMNGVSINWTAEESHRGEEIPEPEEIVTTRTVSQNPLLKIIVIGGVILMFVMLIGGVIHGSMQAFNLSTTKKIAPTQNAQQEVEEPKSDETGKDKTALALTSQSLELKKMRSLKAVPEATPTPSPLPKPVKVVNTPVPIRTTVVQNPTVRREIPLSVRRNQPLRVQRQPTYQPQPRSTPTVKAPDIDPMEKWLAVASAGSFSSNTSTNTTQLVSENSDTTEVIAGGIGKPKTEKPTHKNNSENSQNIDYSQARILVGTRTEGKLETPIAWSNNTAQSNQNYLIKLTKPLKTATGQEVLPKESYLVVQMRGVSQSEYIQLQAVSALVNNQGNTEEKKIPEGTILILAKNGKLLKAESRKGSDLAGTIFSAVLSGVAKASEIQNRPSTQVTTNSYGFSSSTISNDKKDSLAAFTEGTLTEIVNSIQTNNQQRIQQLQSSEQVFVIEAGKSVQIFVNQTISF